MLTERRKADRECMASMVEALCAELGASCEREEYQRGIRVEIVLGEGRVGIEFDGDSPASILDNYCMPWNTIVGSKAKMTPAFGRAVGGEVNPFHRAKCMAFAAGIHALLRRLRAAMECINAGEAFDAPIEAREAA